jgi:hypothetical protein
MTDSFFTALKGKWPRSADFALKAGAQEREGFLKGNIEIGRPHAIFERHRVEISKNSKKIMVQVS